ncbi:MAG: hypothetical protein K1X53_11335 [Candidatus Sumerlaeaceae bacterium]|nr:hypothetical protein [Candidatus Sumerlaeaceae bacterium]
MTTRKPWILAGLAAIVSTMMLVLTGCATTGSHGYTPDYCTVTAVGYYKPVAVPGTQRRLAQDEAEADARRQLLEKAGALPACKGTVNDMIARDQNFRAEVLNKVRTAEVVDWKVEPACGKVTVWMRLDMNVIRAIVAPRCP